MSICGITGKEQLKHLNLYGTNEFVLWLQQSEITLTKAIREMDKLKYAIRHKIPSGADPILFELSYRKQELEATLKYAQEALAAITENLYRANSGHELVERRIGDRRTPLSNPVYRRASMVSSKLNISSDSFSGTAVITPQVYDSFNSDNETNSVTTTSAFTRFVYI